VSLIVVGCLHLRVRHRLRSREVEQVPVPPGFNRVAAARAVSEVVDQALDVLAGDGRADDGRADDAIIGCWQAFLAAARNSGLPRTQSETSSEYVSRITAQAHTDAGSMRTLARLYREARFSDHELSAATRGTARVVLQRIQHDLTGRTASVAADG